MWKLTTILLFVNLFFNLSTSTAQYYSIDFIENKGQWEGDFAFKATQGASTIFLDKRGFRVAKINEFDYRNITHPGSTSFTALSPADTIEIENSVNASAQNALDLKSHNYMATFVGANIDAAYISTKEASNFSNYFIGADPSRWKTHVKSFFEVRRESVYDGIDIKYYSGSNGNLKYDWIVKGNADPSSIKIKYEGVDGIKIRDGNLIIKTSVGEAKELAPIAFQIINGKKVDIKCSYALSKNIVSYSLGNYDHNAELIIDPTLEISTFTGSKSDNWGFSAAPGPDGSLYAGGIVFGSQYPTEGTLGPGFQRIFRGGIGQTFTGGSSIRGVDIGLTRFNSDGNKILFSTYIGGGGDEYPHSIIVDKNGNAIILGRTSSSKNDFPHPAALGGAYTFGPLGGQSDIYVIKISAKGDDVLGSILIGGADVDGANSTPQMVASPSLLVYNYGDHSRSEVMLDKNENILIAASTMSRDFPTRLATGTSTYSGKQDGVVIKLNSSLSNVIFSRFLGGSNEDASFVITTNPVTDDIYVAGPTASADFPGDKAGVLSSTFNGVVDGYISRLSPNGELLKTTYQGTPSLDIIYGIQFDKLGYPYTMGITLGNWPKTPGTYGTDGAKQFITKLKPDFSDYVYTTTFGTKSPKPNISPVAFLVDRCENVYVSGWGGKFNACSNGPFDSNTVGPAGMDISDDAIQKYTDNRDFYFLVVQKNASKLLYGSYFGQRGGEVDHIDGGTSRFDAKGAIYMSICANCAGNNTCLDSRRRPTDPVKAPLKIKLGSPGPTNGALPINGCNLAAVKINFSFDGVDNGVKSAINGVFDTSGCSPLKVNFFDTIAMAKSYIWDFGDGSKIDTTTSPETSHEYVTVKDTIFTVKLISIDDNRCITRDSSFTRIKVGINAVKLSGVPERVGDCTSGIFKLKNTSTSLLGRSFGSRSFVWIYDDGSRPDTVGFQEITHTFTPGLHRVWLKLNDSRFCNHLDSIPIDISVFSTIKADFNLKKDSICVGDQVGFVNNSTGGTGFSWTFDNGQTSTLYTPSDQKFLTAGDKFIKLVISENSPGCSRSDQMTKKLIVNPIPTSKFDYTPTPPKENTPFNFQNKSSSDVTKFLWDFGDGNTSNQSNPIHFFIRPEIFNVALTVYNKFGCSNTSSTTVKPFITVLVEMPNAFTPNGDGKNDTFQPRIFGVDEMNLKIFNRFGQLVFESFNPTDSWDGKFKGVDQPMDVYAYTLYVKYLDGKVSLKKGDITLIR